MKTRLFQFFILSILFIATGCKESDTSDADKVTSNKEQTNTELQNIKKELRDLKENLDKPTEFQERIPKSFDFCDTIPVLQKNGYNRITGRAYFTIPIPKGSNLSYVKMENDTLYYVCDGHGNVKYSPKTLFKYNRTVTGLTRGDFNKRLWVTVSFENFNGSDCTNKDMMLEKKKTSEIEGEPFVSKNEE